MYMLFTAFLHLLILIPLDIFGQSYVVVPHVVRTTAKFSVKAAFLGCVCCTIYLRNTAWVLISFDSHEQREASRPIEFYDLTNDAAFNHFWERAWSWGMGESQRIV